MAYTKTTWVAGTAVTYALLNHAEEQYDEIMTYLAAHDHDDRYYLKAEVDSYFWDETTDGDGSTLDADTLDGVEEAAIVSGADIGIGGWYYGTLDDFTDGYLDADTTWHVCDGSGGSIDLEEVFIVGAGGSFNVGETGGNNSFKPTGECYGNDHILTAAECMHTHDYTDRLWYSLAGGPYSSGPLQGISNHYTSPTHATETAGSGEGHSHSGTFTCATTYSLLPSFIALIPIQKVA